MRKDIQAINEAFMRVLKEQSPSSYNNNEGQVKFNNVSIWYNQYGEDELYAVDYNVEFDQKFIDDNSVKIDWLKGIRREDFSVEERGKNWVMYGYEGIGVLCSNTSMEKAHAEYEELSD